MKKKEKKIVFPIIGLFGGCLIVEHLIIKSLSIELTKQKSLSDKHFELYMLMKNWVKLKQKGVNLSSYFLRKGYNKIAIYGMNYVGRILVDELKNSGLEIVKGIDKDPDAANSDIKVVIPDNFNGHTDISEIIEPDRYKYCVGDFNNYNDAVAYRKKIESEYPDAFVVGIKDNKILPLQQALDMVN